MDFIMAISAAIVGYAVVHSIWAAYERFYR